MLLLVIVFFLGKVALVETSTNIVIMRDSEEFATHSYECLELTAWQKFCKHYDFVSGSCRPWRLESCPEPYVQHQLSPCTSYICEVI